MVNHTSVKRLNCWHDSFIHGIRVTFIWQQFASWGTLLLKRLLAQNVGTPDVLIVDNGPHELAEGVPFRAKYQTHKWGSVQERFLAELEDLQTHINVPVQKEWRGAYQHQPLMIFMNVMDGPETDENPHHQWRVKSREFFSAQLTNWVYFDRSRLSLLETQHRHIYEQCENLSEAQSEEYFGGNTLFHVFYHPMYEALATSVDMIVTNICQIENPV